jgi:lysophospholipase L1-like esterase
VNNKLLLGKLTVTDSIVGLVYLALLILLAVAFFHRGSDAPLIPLNEEIDNDVWVMFAFLVIVAFLGIVFMGFPVAWYKVRRASWTLKDIAATLLFTFAAALLFYVPVSVLYENSLAPKRKIHSHLQLFPRAIPDTVRKDENTIVIAFLGGSTTAWGEWTDQVADRLQAEFPGRNVVVLNQGVQWYTVLHSLINYEANVRHIDPDIVVVMHAINDLTVNADHSYYVNGEFRRDYGHHTGPLARIPRIRPLVELTVDVARHMFFYRAPEVIETDHFQGLPVFKDYYKRLVELIRLDGSLPVVMTQPYLYKVEMSEAERRKIYMDKQNSLGPESRWSIDTARRGMEQYVGAVRALSETEQVPLIDLESVIPKELSHLFDDCHYTELGASLVAEHVSSELAEVIRSSL